MPSSELRADWAAQRIKGLSFFSAAKAAFLGNRGNKIRSLIEEFHYPRFGPGQMWERMQADIEARGGEVRMNAPVTKVEFEGGSAVRVVAGGETIECRGVISSLPISRHDEDRRSRAAGRRARRRPRAALPRLPHRLARDRRARPVPRHWIYIHEPDVEVGRIQNFRSWSPWMVPNDHETSIGMEYFCFAGDDCGRWRTRTSSRSPTKELGQTGLADPSKVKKGFVVRVNKAYPVYDAEYGERLETVRTWLDPLENFIQVGRNGLHRYNNSDHSMLTAMRAVENLCDGAQARHLGGQRRERVPRGGPRGGARPTPTRTRTRRRRQPPSRPRPP